MKPFPSYRFFENDHSITNGDIFFENLETKYQNHSGIKGRNGGKVVM